MPARFRPRPPRNTRAALRLRNADLRHTLAQRETVIRTHDHFRERLAALTGALGLLGLRITRNGTRYVATLDGRAVGGGTYAEAARAGLAALLGRGPNGSAADPPDRP